MSFSGVTTILPVHLRSLDSHTIEKFKRAADSVLAQECSIPAELLVVDDGSVAPLIEQRELAGIFRRDEVTSIQLLKNEGLVFALNAGLTQAKYDLIARIDADDYWRPLKLKKQLQAFSEDQDLSIVGTAMRLVNPDSSLDCDHVRGPTWLDALDFFSRVGNPFPHGSILARRDVFELLGGYPHEPRFRHCEDYALWGSWVRFFKCAMLEDVLFEYSISADQVSTRYSEQQLFATGLVRGSFLNLPNHTLIPEAVEEVARFLQRPLLETSKILCVAWRYYDHILADAEILRAVRLLLPDRRIHVYEDVGNLTADRLFYFHRGVEFDRSLSAHARVVHDVENIVPMIGR